MSSCPLLLVGALTLLQSGPAATPPAGEPPAAEQPKDAGPEDAELKDAEPKDAEPKDAEPKDTPEDASQPADPAQPLGGVGDVEPASAEETAEEGPEPFTTESVWKHWRSWSRFGGEDWSVSFIGALVLDTQAFDQDEDVGQEVGQTDDFESAEIRGLRLGLFATYGQDQANPFTLTFAAAYRGFDAGFNANNDNAWTVFDVAIAGPIAQYGRVSIGKQKSMATMERQMSLINLPFMERSAGSDALLPSRDIGVVYQDNYFNQRVTLGAGVHNDFLEVSGEFDDLSSSASARITSLLVSPDSPNGLLVHFGVHSRWSNARRTKNHRNGMPQGRAASDPEVEFAPRYIDTGSFIYDWVMWYGGELYISYGPLWFGSEILAVHGDLEEPGLDSPTFFAGHAFLAWCITGESRSYDRRVGLYRALIPRKNVYDGGYGAFEVAVRASYTDLDSGDVKGGKLFRLTGAASWHATRQMRVDFNYGYILLDRGEVTNGVTHAFQFRVVLAF